MTDRRPVTRRRLLQGTGVGLAAGLAGCNGLDLSDLPNDVGSGVGSGGSGTSGSTPTGDSDLVLVDDELVARRSPTARPGVRLRVRHDGQERFETVEVEVQPVTAGNDPMSVLHGRGFDVDPGETFEVFVALRDDPSAVDSYGVTFTPRAGDTLTPSSALSLAETALEDAGYTKRVTGRLSNAGDALGYAEVRGKFYDDEGRLLCTDRAATTSLAAGETRAFGVEFVSDDPTAHDRVADFAVEVGGRWWSL